MVNGVQFKESEGVPYNLGFARFETAQVTLSEFSLAICMLDCIIHPAHPSEALEPQGQSRKCYKELPVLFVPLRGASHIL